ncbi:MAG: ankyrin repeat domain-containing protein [Magnetospirillum sp.]|nr:ankyrin repeat domain-containing protein [Magnetospirillum sp.]
MCLGWNTAAFCNPAPPVPIKPLPGIFRMVDDGLVERVEKEWERNPALLAETDNDGRTLLHRAAMAGNADMVRLLLNASLDVNARDFSKKTPLHMAANGQVVEILIARGASISAVDSHRRSALHWAAIRGSKPVVEALLARGANVKDVDYGDATALHFAADAGSADSAAILIARGAVVDAKDRQGRTPLLRAACTGDKAALVFAQRMLSQGADVNAAGNGGCQDLGGTFSPPYDGSNPSSKDGFTPLHLAAFRGDLALARVLLDGKADVDRITERRWTPLHLAAVSARSDIAALLLSHGAAANARDRTGESPLHWVAAATSASVMIDLSWSWIANQDARGWIAAENYLNFARLLVSNGADVNASDAEGRTPLALALKGAGAEIIPVNAEYGLYLRRKHEAMAELLRGAGGQE